MARLAALLTSRKRQQAAALHKSIASPDFLLTHWMTAATF
jgi:hypothetical protein